jgi:hypothetical protein
MLICECTTLSKYIKDIRSYELDATLQGVDFIPSSDEKLEEEWLELRENRRIAFAAIRFRQKLILENKNKIK